MNGHPGCGSFPWSKTIEMQLATRNRFRFSRAVRWVIGGTALVLSWVSPALALPAERPIEPRQILRPLPIDLVNVVWRAEARESGFSFRVYREDGRHQQMLAELPAELGLHDYQLKDLPLAERQLYVLFLVDPQGREHRLRALELKHFHRFDLPLPPVAGSLPLPPAVLAGPLAPAARPAISLGPALANGETALLSQVTSEPPDPPPDLVPCFDRYLDFLVIV